MLGLSHFSFKIRYLKAIPPFHNFLISLDFTRFHNNFLRHSLCFKETSGNKRVVHKIIKEGYRGEKISSCRFLNINHFRRYKGEKDKKNIQRIQKSHLFYPYGGHPSTFGFSFWRTSTGLFSVLQSLLVSISQYIFDPLFPVQHLSFNLLIAI